MLLFSQLFAGQNTGMIKLQLTTPVLINIFKSNRIFGFFHQISTNH